MNAINAITVTNTDAAIAPITYFSFNFLSFISQSPIARVAIVAMMTAVIVQTLSISPNTEDNNNAVTMYFAMSISHLPNSLFILQRYEITHLSTSKSMIILSFEW